MDQTTQQEAQALINRITDTLSTLQVMADQFQTDLATDLDLTTLDLVLDKLEHTEDAWSKANRMLDRMGSEADAQDQAETQSDVRYGGAL